LFQNDLVQTVISVISVIRQNIFEDRTEMFKLLCGPRIGFYKVRKLYRIWNNGPVGTSSSTNGPMG
jgi:hypothetical protein